MLEAGVLAGVATISPPVWVPCCKPPLICLVVYWPLQLAVRAAQAAAPARSSQTDNCCCPCTVSAPTRLLIPLGTCPDQLLAAQHCTAANLVPTAIKLSRHRPLFTTGGTRRASLPGLRGIPASVAGGWCVIAGQCNMKRAHVHACVWHVQVQELGHLCA